MSVIANLKNARSAVRSAKTAHAHTWAPEEAEQQRAVHALLEKAETLINNWLIAARRKEVLAAAEQLSLDAVIRVTGIENEKERGRTAEARAQVAELEKLIADNARDESGRVSMPLAGLRKIDEARARAEEDEKWVLILRGALLDQAGWTPGDDSQVCWCNNESCRCTDRPWCVSAREALDVTPADLAARYIGVEQVRELFFAETLISQDRLDAVLAKLREVKP